MKKRLFVFIFLLLSTYCNSEVFFSLQDKNPFIDDLYLENYNLVQNKIIKTVSEDYEITNDGHKYYGDSEIGYKIIKYYFFNEKSYLTDYYYIYVTDDSKVFYKKHWNYKYSSNHYSVTEENLLTKDIIIKEYNIENQENMTVLSFYDSSQDYIEKIIIESNKKTIIEQKYDWDAVKTERVYKDKLSTVNIYNGNKLRNTFKYYCGGKIEYTQYNYLNKYSLLEKYDFDDYKTGVINTILSDNKEIYSQKTDARIYREYNNIGFLEKEIIEPYDRKEGNYSFFNAYLLFQKDEQFKLYFE